MVLFGRFSRGKGPARPKATRPVLARATVAPARKPVGPLHDRLKDIATAHTPEEAMALVLQEVIDTLRAAAAAYCLFDPKQRALHLAAEVGISDEGCQHLRRCLLYTSPSPRDLSTSRMPSSA